MRIVQTAIIFSIIFLPINSFAADPPLLADLPDAEHDYYEQIFIYAMQEVPAEKPYDWQSYNASGTITPGKLFTSKSGSTCRKFSETFTVGDEQGERQGVGCKRNGEDGWCRLKPDNALTCALEKPEGLFDEGRREIGGGMQREKNNLGVYRDEYSPY